MSGVIYADGEALRQDARARYGRFLFKADVSWPDERLRLLKSETPPPLAVEPDQIAGAVNARLGIRGVVRPLSVVGTFHVLFSFESAVHEPVIVRVSRFEKGLTDGAMAFGPALTAALKEAGIFAPRTRLCDLTREFLPFDFELQDAVFGVPLSSIESDETAIRRSLIDAAALLARVHEIEVCGYGPLNPWMAAHSRTVLHGVQSRWSCYLKTRANAHVTALEHAQEISARTAARVREQFLRLSEFPFVAPRLLHGDPGGSNIILEVTTGLPALIDWEDALAGDPLFDLANLATFHPECRLPAIVSGYSTVTSLDASRASDFWLYFLRISVAKQVHRFRFGLSDRPGREPAKNRIYRALDHLEGGLCEFC